MIRICQVMGYMNGGGVESVVMNYYRCINHDMYQFDFIVCEGSTHIPREEIEGLGGRVFLVPDYSDLGRYRAALRRLFQEEGWEIVHSHMNALSIFSLSVAEEVNIPVRIAHSHTSTGKGEFLKSLIKNILRLQSNRYPTHKVACSEHAGKWLFGNKASFSLIPNSVDLEAFRFDASMREKVRLALGVKIDQLVIGHIGRFAPQKNHAFLLEVFEKVLNLVPDAVLVLVGDGPLMEDVKEKVSEKGITQSVVFLGNCQDTMALYSSFDLFCLPSLYEGLPMVGVECQASGIPILASDEVTREAAATSLMEFESLSSNPEIWARHLIGMKGMSLDESDRRTIIKFDIHHNARLLEDFYSMCMEDSRGAN